MPTERIARLGYDYVARAKARIPCCNLCGHDRFLTLAHRDRYGYPATACSCLRCGLVALNPVMTVDEYRKFYVSVYRPLVSAFHGRVIDANTIQDEQRRYAVERTNFLSTYLSNHHSGKMLDIGGSTGIVANLFSKQFGLEGTVLDPAPLEIEKAQALGLETVTCLLEDYDPGLVRYDLIILCQTVDHLLDVAAAMHKIHQLLTPCGIFFVDIVDFRAAYLRNQSIEKSIKIDHPYYLTETTMECYLVRAGFEVLGKDYAEDHLHISYACKIGPPQSDNLPLAGEVNRLWREIRMIQNNPI